MTAYALCRQAKYYLGKAEMACSFMANVDSVAYAPCRQACDVKTDMACMACRMLGLQLSCAQCQALSYMTRHGQFGMSASSLCVLTAG